MYGSMKGNRMFQVQEESEIVESHRKWGMETCLGTCSVGPDILPWKFYIYSEEKEESALQKQHSLHMT